MSVRTVDEVVDRAIDEARKIQKNKGLETYNQTLDECPDDAYNWDSETIFELVDALSYQAKENLRLKKLLHQEKGKRLSLELKLNQLNRSGTR